MSEKSGYNLRSKGQVPRPRLDIDVESSKSGSVKSRTPSKSGSSSRHSTVRSSKVRNLEVDQDTAEALAEVDDEVNEIEVKQQQLQLRKTQLEEKLKRKQTSLEKLDPADRLEIRTMEKEILDVEEEIQEHECRIQWENIDHNGALKKLEKRKSLILGRQNVLKEIILEEDDQGGLSEEEMQKEESTEKDEQLISRDDSALSDLNKKIAKDKEAAEQRMARFLEDEKKRQQEEADRLFALQVEALEKAKKEEEESVKKSDELRQRRIVLQEVVEKGKVDPKEDTVKVEKVVSVASDSLSQADQFAMALVKALDSRVVSSPGQDNTHKFLARQAYGKDLPRFSGKPEDWPKFEADFIRSTEDCGFSDSDNLGRLRKCLHGDAEKYVSQLMLAPKNVPKVMANLKKRFGQPSHIIQAMIAKVQAVPNVKVENLQGLVEFGCAVENFTATVVSLNQPEYLNDKRLLEELERKLPHSIRIQWLEWLELDPSRKKNLENFSSWLSKKTDMACEICPPIPTEEKTAPPKDHRRKQEKVRSEDDLPTVAGLHISGKRSCVFCGKHSDHLECFSAEKMPYEEKMKILTENRACFRCARVGHSSKFCPNPISCKHCGKPHVSSLCYKLSSNKRESEDYRERWRNGPIQTFVPLLQPAAPAAVVTLPEQNPAEDVSTTTSTSTSTTTVANMKGTSDIILKTLLVTVVGRWGKKQIRAFIDDGAQNSYISKKVIKDLELLAMEGSESVVHTGFGGMKTGPVNHRIYDVLVECPQGQGRIKLRMRDQEKICEDLPRAPPGPWMNELRRRDIWVNDLEGESKEIGMLIGADNLAKIYTQQSHVHLRNGLIAVRTILGWTLLGKAQDGDFDLNVRTNLHVANMSVLDLSMDQLWSLETLGIKDPIESLSKKEGEEAARQHFSSTVMRNDDGRYCVSLPWVGERPQIPTNRGIAEQRLDSMTRKLVSQGKFEAYDTILKNWEEENIIEEVPPEELDLPCHYVPHRAVFKPDSLTTPIRPVFDASCGTNRNPSLNDCLEKGPNLLELIPSIMLRFREKPIGLSSDIRKAFQMIEVKKEDRDFQRFLWYTDEARRKMKVYRHCRVMFGMNCSPFLLGAVLEHLLSSVKVEDRDLALILLKSLYVDNSVTSLDTIEECCDFKKWSTDLLDGAKMELRCWEAGCKDKSRIGSLTSRECGLDFGQSPLEEGSKAVTSVLGYKWNKVNDTICCDISPFVAPEKVTKRAILSHVQRVFDPIGFTCPATIQPKLCLQKLWTTKIGWDIEVPMEDADSFSKWSNEEECLGEIAIPRVMTGESSDRKTWQLHVFCDASKDAYAAVVFLRTREDDVVSIQLISAKSRVAPIKKGTINRLELMSCYVGALLTAAVRESLDLKGVPECYWTDSSTALAWIKGNDNWGTFVGNRVKTICSVTEFKDWRHVPGVMNPADLPSRGCSPSQLLESKWWEGPDWLYAPEEEWPSDTPTAEEDLVLAEVKKTKKTTSMAVVDLQNLWYVPRLFYLKNVRIMAWVLRFLRAIKKDRVLSDNRIVLSAEEMSSAEMTLIKLTQRDTIPMDESSVEGIHVFKEEGLVRVRSKLSANLEEVDFCNPILLPHAHSLVEQLIRHVHVSNNHAGAQFIMGWIRRRFWIIRGRKAVRRVVHRCMTCRRYSTKRQNVVPAPLPEDRVRTGRPFETTGVDLAGPLFVKEGKTTKKVWIALFTCAVYRCVHLEVVKSLSAEEFMESFARFQARRGRPETIYSDNGTNFHGADNALKTLDWEKIEGDLAMKMIKWRFNPPASPWWGGFWERLVRTVKDLLRKSLRQAKLTFEKLCTVLCEIEAVVNGRPLTTVTEDPEDLRPLTPAMFLHDLPRSTVSDAELLACGFQKTYADRNKTIEQLRSQFRKQYLAELVHRGKQKKVREFQVGEVVLVGSDDKKRVLWPLAKIVELIPGRDGNVRVARVKTAKGELTRPIQWIFPMEVSQRKELPNQLTTAATDDDIQENKDDDDSPTDQLQQQSVIKTKFGRIIKTPERYGA